MATPIINQPQVAILDFEAVVKRPVVVTDADGNDSIAIRPMTILGLSWDHRALDGALSAQFLASGQAPPGGRSAVTPPRALGLPSGRRRLPRGARAAGADPRRAPGGRDARRAADARAPAGLHARPAVGARRAADGRGLVPGAGHRDGRRPTAAARSPTTAPASSSAIRSSASTTWWPTCGCSSGRWWRRWREEGVAGPSPAEDGPRLHRRLGGRSARSRRSACTCPRGVTTHGFAVNVENDLQPFSWIVPCGLDGVQMTSLITETGRGAGQMKCFRRRAAWQVARGAGAPAAAGEPGPARAGSGCS